MLFLSTEKCDEALASPLPHTAFTSSSVFSSGYAPGYAKLNRRGGIQTYTDTHTRTSLQMAMYSHIYAFCWRALLTCSVDRDKSKYLIQVRVHTALWMILEMTHCEINVQAFIEWHTSQCCTAALTTFLLFFSFLSFYFFIFLLLLFPPSLDFNHYLGDSDWSSFPHQSTAKTDRDRQLHPSVFIQLIIHTFPSNIAALQLRQQHWHIKAR